METQLLFDEGVTAKGKPLVYHLMNEDLKKAYDAVKEAAGLSTPVTPVFLQKLNALLMRTTGGKVPAKVEELCAILQTKLQDAKTIQEQYELSFNAHLNLVTIHPWVDGNGRTARLLMNYLQFYHGLFPAKIFIDDRADYILSL